MTEGNADALERRRLTQENEMLRQKIEELTQENGSLKQRLEKLTQNKERLREENLRQRKDVWSFAMKLHQVSQRLEESEKRTHELQSLKQEMEELIRRRVCSSDCVSCVIITIFENIPDLGVKLCCAQLRTIISLHAGHKFERKHFKCVEFMDLLSKCGIVKRYETAYMYPPEMLSRENEMAKAFNELMKMRPSSGVVIIGRVISTANNHGHAELCFLNTRTQDGKLTIHDPQREISGEGGEQDFINYVKNDEGVIFYSVIIDELKQIYNNYFSVLHFNTCDPNFSTATGDINGDR